MQTLTAKDMITIDRFPPDRRALYSPIKHWNTAYKGKLAHVVSLNHSYICDHVCVCELLCIVTGMQIRS